VASISGSDAALRSTRTLDGTQSMSTAIRTIAVLATLALLATILLSVGARFPEPFRVVDGSGIIGLALLIYIFSLLAIASLPFFWLQFREALRSRYRFLFATSAIIVFVYIVGVSIALYGLSQATDL
jgi:drug/metabolite transporter (DMT)-like permease